jgi:hypothetical protein
MESLLTRYSRAILARLVQFTNARSISSRRAGVHTEHCIHAALEKALLVVLTRLTTGAIPSLVAGQFIFTSWISVESSLRPSALARASLPMTGFKSPRCPICSPWPQIRRKTGGGEGNQFEQSRPNLEPSLELRDRIGCIRAMDLDGVQKKTTRNPIDPDRPDFSEISVVV